MQEAAIEMQPCRECLLGVKKSGMAVPDGYNTCRMTELSPKVSSAYDKCNQRFTVLPPGVFYCYCQVELIKQVKQRVRAGALIYQMY